MIVTPVGFVVPLTIQHKLLALNHFGFSQVDLCFFVSVLSLQIKVSYSGGGWIGGD